MVDLLVIVFGLGNQFLIVGQRSREFFRPTSTQQFAQRSASHLQTRISGSAT
jgi:hypothetical protein